MKYNRLCLMSLIVACALAILTGGCNEKTITEVVDQREPVLYGISGRVFSCPDGKAVAGALCRLTSLETGDQSLADGSFHLDGVEAGTYMLSVSAPGHATVLVDVMLGGEVETSSLKLLDVFIPKRDATLELVVYGTPDGLPLSHANLDISAITMPYEGHHVDLLQYLIGATTDSLGTVVIDSLPAVLVGITVRSHDADGDGQIDYRAKSADFELSSAALIKGQIVVERPGPVTPQILETNIPAAYQKLMATRAWMYFSEPMDTLSTSAHVVLYWTNYGYNEVAATVKWISTRHLEIKPASRLEIDTRRYTLSVKVYSAAGDSLYLSRTFYWMTSDDPLGNDCEDPVAGLGLSPGHESLDQDTAALELIWLSSPCADGYYIYGRDDFENTEWRRLQAVTEVPESDTYEVSVELPLFFDRFMSDELQTPFAGTNVMLCVVPMNAAEPQPGDPHDILILSDETPPAIVKACQYGAAYNSREQASELKINALFSEYIHRNSPEPVLHVAEDGGDPGFALDPADGSWTWLPGRREGYFSFTLEPGQDTSGDEWWITFDGVLDMSGNAAAANSRTESVVLEACYNFYDFNDSGQGWSRDGPGWAWGSPEILWPEIAHSGDTCWGVVLDEPYEYLWETSLYSPEVYICGDSSIVNFWCWHDLVSNGDYVQAYVVDEDWNTYLMDTYVKQSIGWLNKEISLDAFTGQTVRIQFKFISDNSSYYVGAGMFVDDVFIGAAGGP